MTKKNKAYKFRAYPNPLQLLLMKKTCGSVRFVYNKMLEERKENYEANKNDSELLKKIKNPTPAKYKNEFPFLKEVDSLALANAQLNLDKAYKAFFKGNSMFPKFKNRKNKWNYTTNVVNGNIKIDDGHIKLPKLKWIKIIMHRQIPESHKIKSVTVSISRSGKVHVSVLTEYEIEIKPVVPNNVVGLDFSMSVLYVSSDGERANYPRFYRTTLEKLAKEQRILSRRKKGSARWNKQKLKVAKLHDKIACQRKDFLHKKSYRLAENYDAIAIEDLHMQGMSQALNFGKSVADNAWGMFTTFLQYKFEERGKHFVKIDKWFPSSKTCSNCNRINKELKLSDRIYSCVCGLILDRDENASINIENEGKRILSSEKIVS